MKDSTLKKFKEDMVEELELDRGRTFTVLFSKDKEQVADLPLVRKEIKKLYPDARNMADIKGIYKIFVKQKKKDEKELFYIGMSTSKIYSRLKTHFDKPNKIKNNNDAPKRYKLFEPFKNRNNELIIEIIRIKDDEKLKLKYLLLLEEVLTLVEKPKYKDGLNNRIKTNPDQQ